VRTLPGDHIRPLQQAMVDLPPELARAANQAVAQGGSLLGACSVGSGAGVGARGLGGWGEVKRKGGCFNALGRRAADCRGIFKWKVGVFRKESETHPQRETRGINEPNPTQPPVPHHSNRHCCTGRLAGLAQQAGIQQASQPLEDLSKGVNSLAEMLGGQVGGVRGLGGWAGGCV